MKKAPKVPKETDPPKLIQTTLQSKERVKLPRESLRLSPLWIEDGAFAKNAVIQEILARVGTSFGVRHWGIKEWDSESGLEATTQFATPDAETTLMRTLLKCNQRRDGRSTKRNRGLRITTAKAAVGCSWRLLNDGARLVAQGLCALSLSMLSPALKCSAGEADAPLSAPASQLEATNSTESLLIFHQIMGQLSDNRLALAQNTKEVREAAARNAAVLSNGLQTIEAAYAAQQAAFLARTVQESEARQSSSRLMVALGGTFVTIAALALLIITWFQWRMSKAWNGLSMGLPMSDQVRHLNVPVLGAADSNPIGVGPIEDSNRRLLGALDQMERRIDYLEGNSKSTRKPNGRLGSLQKNGHLPAESTGAAAPELSQGTEEINNLRISEVLAKGQAMFKQNDLEAAIKCFEEVLSLSPNHSEALVKKGAALERLKRLNEAFEYYDRAIAADASMTIAYLHKGGLCNRLERFKEALECYEKALHTHEEWHG